MNGRLERAIIVGVISQTLAISAMFVIFSALFTDSTSLTFAFFIMSLVMVASIYVSRFTGRQLRERGLFAVGVTIIGIAIAITASFVYELDPFWLLLYVGGGLFLLRRIIPLCLANDAVLIRGGLLDQFRLDLKLLIGLAIAVLIFEVDASWRSVVVPLFVSFLLTRLLALSLTSALASEEDNQAGRFGRNSMLIVSLAVIGGWVLNAFGIPVTRLVLVVISVLLQPIIYVVGMVGGFIVEWLLPYIQGGELVDSTISGTGGYDELESIANEYVSSTVNLEWIVYALVIALCLAFIRFVYKRLTGLREQGTDGSTVEVREFIRYTKHTPNVADEYSFSDPQTPIRKQYLQFLLAMGRKGFHRDKGETAIEYADKLAASRPDIKRDLDELTDYYMQERYRHSSLENKQNRVKQLVVRLIGKYSDEQ